MTITPKGHGLIFLASQPRAGSTLVQRVLGAHPAVNTASEPWLLLPPLYALRPGGHQAEYNAGIANRALKDFLCHLPDGEAAYDEGVRRMYTYLYEQAMAGTSATHFLDKTPRYYTILPDLRRVFPDSKTILLLRNPLAVLASILDTWVGDEWFKLAKSRLDLLAAPPLLLAGYRAADPSTAVVRYEQMVNRPHETAQHLCDHLGLDYQPDMVTYGKSGQTDWRHGDPGTVHTYDQPVAPRTEKWIDRSARDPQVWRLMYDYLLYLGPDLTNALQYPYADMLDTLERCRPEPQDLRMTLSLDWLLSTPTQDRTALEHAGLRAYNAYRRNGLQETATRALARSGRQAATVSKSLLRRLQAAWS